MEIEKYLVLSNGEKFFGNELDKLLNKRDAIRKQNTHPSQLFKDINISNLQIKMVPTEPIGHLKTKFGEREVDQEPLFEIPDIVIDLTPEATGPRAVMTFEINSNGKTISIEALFDETSRPEFMQADDPENPNKIEPFIREELLNIILQEQDWQKGHFEQSWFAVK